MAETIHPLAPHHLPSFIPAMDGSDALKTNIAILLVVAIFLIGVFYLHLHSLPERRLHGKEKAQFEIVAVLALLALFTHNNLFWIAALILGMIHIPDIWTPVASMAESLRRIAATTSEKPDAPVNEEDDTATTEVTEPADETETTRA